MSLGIASWPTSTVSFCRWDLNPRTRGTGTWNQRVWPLRYPCPHDQCWPIFCFLNMHKWSVQIVFFRSQRCYSWTMRKVKPKIHSTDTLDLLESLSNSKEKDNIEDGEGEPRVSLEMKKKHKASKSDVGLNDLEAATSLKPPSSVKITLHIEHQKTNATIWRLFALAKPEWYLILVGTGVYFCVIDALTSLSLCSFDQYCKFDHKCIWWNDSAIFHR